MSITLLEQRAIEAGIFKALYETMMEEGGREGALKTIERTVRGLALEAGRAFAAKATDGPNFEHFKTVLGLWRGTGALDIEDVKASPDEICFIVTRCAYVETYRQLGLPPELAVLISCCRDEPFAKGYSERVHMERSETIGAGGQCCRFRFTWRD